MKVLVGAFNQEKALVGAFSVIVKNGCGTDGALHSTSPGTTWPPGSGAARTGQSTLRLLTFKIPKFHIFNLQTLNFAN